ncbi:MAG: 3-deoxy-D-manno-octulosonic acid transferase [Campylobacteraceae bacterium 4484_4]|nr:MAG: 3-deoxy-D-manno-octulosonic acid transferase [Campylobacteraceae bacterium 4484_4]
MKEFSEYIIYVDESGDHSLVSGNPQYPLFVLAFCIFRKESYRQSAVTKLKSFKFKHFGHDMVILHENEIRRDKGAFRFLKSLEKKERFIGELTQIIDEEEFTVIATVIRKDKLQVKTNNPYDIALRFCLERAYMFLKEKDMNDKLTHVVVERRGKKEDEALELEFRRICQGHNFTGENFPFEIVMASKYSNSAGLQLADMIARPIGISVLKPQQENRAYEIIKRKLHRNRQGKVNGIGLKIFP